LIFGDVSQRRARDDRAHSQIALTPTSTIVAFARYPAKVGGKAARQTQGVRGWIPVNSIGRDWVAKRRSFILHCKQGLRLEHNPAI
jgi:hypothetical protein